MMKKGMKITSIILVFVLFIIPVEEVFAFPILPSSFYGTVLVNGENVPEGTLIEAIINDNVITQGYSTLYENKSVYSLNVFGKTSGTPGQVGGEEEDIVNFKVGGQMADQIGVWHSGTNEQVDLTLTTSIALEAPFAIPAAMATQTAIPYVESVRSTMQIPVTGAEKTKPSLLIDFLLTFAGLIVCIGLGIWLIKIRKSMT